jgi:hypothetical protein
MSKIFRSSDITGALGELDQRFIAFKSGSARKRLRIRSVSKKITSQAFQYRKDIRTL